MAGKETIRARASASAIDAIKAGEKERLVSDEATPNLYLMVRPGGAKTWRWIARLKFSAATRKMTLGKWPAYSLANARDWAKARNDERDRGDDPIALAGAVSAAAAKVVSDKKQADKNTVEAVFETYMKTKERLKSAHEKRRLMKANFLETYGSRPIADLTKADVRAARDVVRDRGSRGAANRVLVEINNFLRFAADEDLVEYNVAGTLKKDTDAEGTNPRRALTLAELAYLWRASGTLRDNERDFIRLLLLTGCRRSESAGARLSELDRGIWKIPRERSKTKVVYKLPIAPLALSIFEERKDQGRDLLFNESYYKSLFNPAIKLLHASVDVVAGKPVAAWDLHSIRHGIRTELDENQICDAATAEKIINHSAQTYDKSENIIAKRDALVKWEAVLLAEVARQTRA